MTDTTDNNNQILVLIVEDNEINSAMMIRWLNKRGYKYEHARDGAAAVDMALSLLPDIILMDINLPKVSGWDATKQIRADDRGKEVPIIALTAKAFESDEKKSREAGCDAHLTKPVNLSELDEQIKLLLKR